MDPVRVKNATDSMGAPRDWDEKRWGPCTELWVRFHDGLVESAWKPTADELKRLQAGQAVIIRIVSNFQPPVAMYVDEAEEIH